MITRLRRPWLVLLCLGTLPFLYYISKGVVFKSSTADKKPVSINTRENNPQLSRERPSVIKRQDTKPAEILANKNSSSFVLRAPRKKRKGRFSGSTGQHKFYHAKARDWEVDKRLVREMCRDTNYTQCNPPRRRTEQEKEADRAAHKPFKVVIFKRFDPDPTIPKFTECNYNNCVYQGTTVTTDTDAVYIYGVGLNERSRMPAVRLPHQVVVFSIFEPPYKHSSTAFFDPNSKWRYYFNATQTYMLDSDIRFSYGKLDFQLREPKNQPDYRAIARKKSRTAIWIVSNCDASLSKRMPYVREMQKYIDIDIFGGCGEKCEVNDERCIPDLDTTYRFYLAFENSYCTDYLTEKFFKLFIDDMHIIPIVRGSADYTNEFPEKTHVNAGNFKGPKELALFLKALEENEDEYTKYLEVKDRYRSVKFGNRYCYICEYLHKLQALPESRRHRTLDMKKVFYDGHVHKAPTW